MNRYSYIENKGKKSIAEFETLIHKTLTILHSTPIFMLLEGSAILNEGRL